jgi:rare lipoprotein A
LIFSFFFLSCESPYMVKHPVSAGDIYYLYATYYGDEFEGRQSADGSTFSQNELTCAAKGFPFGTMLEVRSISTGKKVLVKVTDRPGKNVVDLSKTAFGEIEDLSKGKVRVKVKVVNRKSAVKSKNRKTETDLFYTLQVLKFDNLEDAKKGEAEMNHDCYILSKEDKYYVRCGSFSNKNEAEKYKNENFPDNKDAVVVEMAN